MHGHVALGERGHALRCDTVKMAYHDTHIRVIRNIICKTTDRFK